MVVMMMAGIRTSHHVLLLYVVLSVCMKTSVVVGIISSSADADMQCIERERDALLTIKKDLVDEHDHLSSWSNEEGEKNCCKWRGIRCNNITGHVTMLDLRVSNFYHYKPFKGKISPSLLELQHLTYLDLSQNYFRWSRIPNFIGSLSKLRYLNLSTSSFEGPIPYQLGNLSQLQCLDLNFNANLTSENLVWLSNMSSLRYLYMSWVNLEKAVDWIPTINMLPSIVDLRLNLCFLSQTIPPNHSSYNSSRLLSVLDLSNNYFTSKINHWLLNFVGTNIVHLDLSWNQLEGPILDVFGNMTSLAHLDLSYNQIQGGIPKSIGNLLYIRTLNLNYNNLNGNLPEIVRNLSWSVMDTLEVLVLSSNKISGPVPDITIFSSLKELHLQNNRLNGTLPRSFQQPSKLSVLDMSGNQIKGSLPDLYAFPFLHELRLPNNQINGSLTESIGQLSKLEILDVASNHFRGTISNAHFSNLPNLKYLDLSNNPLILNFSSEWHPPFQLDTLSLGSCKLGPHFPVWLRNQKNVSYLDISNSGISDVIPYWFYDLLYNSYYLNISHNQMRGILPDLPSKFVGFPGIDMSSNHLQGPIPLLPSNITSLNLSNNMFRGSISAICAITGMSFGYLDLSNNLLSGRLPDCWWRLDGLYVLNLDNNYFYGEIPSSMGSLLSIESLHLRNNSLIGELPSSLLNCTSLKVMDIGENRLSGNIPAWIGEKLSDLRILRLRSNEFYGSIPLQLCYLRYVQILDISLNNITGTMPQCFNNFTTMAQQGGLIEAITFYYELFGQPSGGGDLLTKSVGYGVMVGGENRYFSGRYVDNALVSWKGVIFEYRNTLGLVKSIDLSSNKLMGEIPVEITNLSGLVALNLSRNNLVGHIPLKIGLLRSLQSLDLSRNRIFGEIPGSMADLNYLSHLDLSYNNLSGKIPSSTQLQSLEASAFYRNRALCGPPLTQKCLGDYTNQSPPTTGGSEDAETQEHEDELVLDRWFYANIALGFIVGFWGVCGTLVLDRSWRHAYFQFFDSSKDWLYVRIAVHTARLKRTFWHDADN